jgi:tRNA/rRNA methyltransferase
MPPGLQDRIVIVLVRARNPSNIGAVARAMHDLGYTHLRVVNGFPVPFEAAKSAVDASSVLAAATSPTTVAEAIADCTSVLGTTAVGTRVLEHPLYTLTESIPVIHSYLGSAREAKIAILFGSEKTGLSNDELSHCHALLTIPMHNPGDGHHLSMNLGQAAAICLYTLAQSEPKTRSSTNLGAPRLDSETWDGTTSEPRATSADLERLTTLLLEVMQTSGYTRRHPANSRDAILRRLTRRMALAPKDAQVWTGILRQVLHALEAAPQQKPADNNPATESKL